MIDNNSNSNQNINFIRDKFRDYYKSVFVDNLIDIPKREFGIGEYGKKISARHLSFASVKDYNNYLRAYTPFYISYSTAY
ncbi:MAG: hypothetical protein V1824_04100, partial [archaeon]